MRKYDTVTDRYLLKLRPARISPRSKTNSADGKSSNSSVKRYAPNSRTCGRGLSGSNRRRLSCSTNIRTPFSILSGTRTLNGFGSSERRKMSAKAVERSRRACSTCTSFGVQRAGRTTRTRSTTSRSQSAKLRGWCSRSRATW